MPKEDKCFFYEDIEAWHCLRCGRTWRSRLNTGELSLELVEEYRDEDGERHEAFPLKCHSCNSPYWYEPRKGEEATSVVVVINVKKFKCMRPHCGNIWIPAKANVAPKKCPKCKSPSWKRFRRRGTKKVKEPV